MVDSVRFPPSIGGSGKTYTNDANPQTGMFNGGHRANFFPILSDTVAAAGYVAQYAQAIDGAKANANKAEDAKGYVEAVADQYQVNILEQFRRKATLDLDFERGVYRADDGTVIETTDANDLLLVNRNSSKWAGGINGVFRDVPIDAIARVWRNVEPLGLIYEAASANIALESSMNGLPWGVDRCTRQTVQMLGYDGTYKTVAVYVPNTENSQHFFYNSPFFSVTPGATYTQSIWVPKNRNYGIRFIYRSDGTPPQNANLNATKIDESNGWERLSYTFENPSDSTALQLRMYIYQGNEIAYEGDGITGLAVDDIQLELGTVASSNIITGTSSVARGNDSVGYENLGGFTAGQGFTIFGRFRLDGNRVTPDTASGIVTVFDDGSTSTNGSTMLFVRNDAGPTGRVRFQSTIFPNIVQDIISNPYDREWHSFGISLKNGKQILRVDGSEHIFTDDCDPEEFFLMTQKLGIFSYSRTAFNRPPGVAYMRRLMVLPFALTSAELETLTAT